MSNSFEQTTSGAKNLTKEARRRWHQRAFNHAVDRAYKRYSFKLTKELLLDAAEQIRKRECLTAKCYEDAGVFIVTIEGRAFPVIYDFTLKAITTFLPPTDARLKPYNLAIGRTREEFEEICKPPPPAEPHVSSSEVIKVSHPATTWQRIKAAWDVLIDRR